jgi:hypothetical protein
MLPAENLFKKGIADLYATKPKENPYKRRCRINVKLFDLHMTRIS